MGDKTWMIDVTIDERDRRTRAKASLTIDQTDDLLSCLYGLHALLRLHFIQEEECYFSLASDPAERLARNRDDHRANRTG